MVRFYKDIIPDLEQTKATGIKKFRDCVMIQIMVPGDRRNIIVREVRDDDKLRFTKHWERFQSSDEETLDGYPLAQWALLSRAQVEELKYLGFRTVENVALANEAAFSKYPGLRELSRRAAAWLEAQNGAAPIEKMQSIIDSQAEMLVQLQTQMRALLEGAGHDPQQAKASAIITQENLEKVTQVNDVDPPNLGEGDKVTTKSK